MVPEQVTESFLTNLNLVREDSRDIEGLNSAHGQGNPIPDSEIHAEKKLSFYEALRHKLSD